MVYNGRMATMYLTPEQVALQIQVNVETVYRYLRAGKLRGARVSYKCWRVAQSDLDSFMRPKGK